MGKQMTLLELTGQESGAVVYDNGNTIICNWSALEGLPYVFGPFLMDMNMESISVKLFEKIKDAFEYIGDIIFDTNKEAQSLKNHPATI